MDEAASLTRTCELTLPDTSRRSMKLSTQNQFGFTYLGLVILIAIIGLTAVASIQVGSIVQRRAAEEELLEIGNEFRAALISYAAATPQGATTLPSTVEDLLRDHRYLGTRRHLRKLYIDPLTGKDDWGVIIGANTTGSGIVAFYSMADGMPIKVDGFSPPFKHFKGKKSYHEWLFLADSPAEKEEAPSTDPNPPATPPSTPKKSNPVPRAVPGRIPVRN